MGLVLDTYLKMQLFFTIPTPFGLNKDTDYQIMRRLFIGITLCLRLKIKIQQNLLDNI